MVRRQQSNDFLVQGRPKAGEELDLSFLSIEMLSLNGLAGRLDARFLASGMLS